MYSNIKLAGQYNIILPSLFFKRSFLIEPLLDEKDYSVGSRDSDRLEIFDLKISNYLSYQSLNFNKSDFLDRLNIEFHEVSSKKGYLLIMEIADIAVKPSYRSRGIGGQLLAILEEIGLNNKVKYIVGELQEDRQGEPLEDRINFFRNHGFSVLKNEKADLSGWIVKKSLKS